MLFIFVDHLFLQGNVLTFCTKCGNELVEGAKFCPKCGMAVDSAARRSKRESFDRPKRKPISTMAIALRSIIAVFVIVGFLAVLSILGG